MIDYLRWYHKLYCQFLHWYFSQTQRKRLCIVSWILSYQKPLLAFTSLLTYKMVNSVRDQSFLCQPLSLFVIVIDCLLAVLTFQNHKGCLYRVLFWLVLCFHLQCWLFWSILYRFGQKICLFTSLFWGIKPTHNMYSIFGQSFLLDSGHFTINQDQQTQHSYLLICTFVPLVIHFFTILIAQKEFASIVYH